MKFFGGKLFKPFTIPRNGSPLPPPTRRNRFRFILPFQFATLMQIRTARLCHNAAGIFPVDR